jgi:hypothetical protein
MITSIYSLVYLKVRDATTHLKAYGIPYSVWQSDSDTEIRVECLSDLPEESLTALSELTEISLPDLRSLHIIIFY